MKTKLQCIARFVGRAMERLLGVMGGVIWTLVGWFAAFHVYMAMHYPPHLLLVVGLLLLFCFGLWGLWKPSYFSLFSGPLLSCFLGDGPQDDDKRWVQFFAPFVLFAALLSLIVGALLQIQAATIVGAVLFVGYAVLGPRVFRGGGDRSKRAIEQPADRSAPHVGTREK